MSLLTDHDQVRQNPLHHLFAKKGRGGSNFKDNIKKERGGSKHKNAQAVGAGRWSIYNTKYIIHLSRQALKKSRGPLSNFILSCLLQTFLIIHFWANCFFPHLHDFERQNWLFLKIINYIDLLILVCHLNFVLFI